MTGYKNDLFFSMNETDLGSYAVGNNPKVTDDNVIDSLGNDSMKLFKYLTDNQMKANNDKYHLFISGSKNRSLLKLQTSHRRATDESHKSRRPLQTKQRQMSHSQLETSHRQVKDDYRQITDDYRRATDYYKQHVLQRRILSHLLLLKYSPYNYCCKA